MPGIVLILTLPSDIWHRCKTPEFKICTCRGIALLHTPSTYIFWDIFKSVHISKFNYVNIRINYILFSFHVLNLIYIYDYYYMTKRATYIHHHRILSLNIIWAFDWWLSDFLAAISTLFSCWRSRGAMEWYQKSPCL